eukprot:15337250-Ditylum_brightwellii.AAC.1
MTLLIHDSPKSSPPTHGMIQSFKEDKNVKSSAIVDEVVIFWSGMKDNAILCHSQRASRIGWILL